LATSWRTIVIGDVHGCLEELDALLRAADYRPGRDRLVLLGDLLDRGPDGVGVVRRARELGADVVCGNHEEKHLRWAAHRARQREDPGYRIPMRLGPRREAEHARLSDDDLRWLAALPPAIALDGGWVAVHAGALPGVPLEAQPPHVLLHLRDVDPEGRPLLGGALPCGPARPWAQAWTGPASVVYGHRVHALDAPRWDEPVPGVVCAGIDTGCCYGGRLTALVLPSREIVQVAAREPYASRGGAAAHRPGAGVAPPATGHGARAALAARTAAAVAAGRYVAPSGREVAIRDAVVAAVRGARDHAPWERLPRPARRDGAARVEVSAESTLEAARRLAASGADPVALVFASARRPAHDRAARGDAQEAAIVRASALGPCLAHRRLYDGVSSDPLRSGWAAYVRGVPVIAAGDGAALEEPWRCAFIACAAPNASAAQARGVPRERTRAALRDRIQRVLAVAEGHGHRALVLGAWGCGACKNDPADVAALFADALAGPFHGAFDEVVFAILDATPGRAIEAAFRARFG
jgi:bis(5'-nucleosyl)-tetraphosphatase (symmetrical)